MTQEQLDAGKLCYCTATCGSNFHTRCLRMYATHQESERKKVTCPMCRGEWGELPTEPDAKAASTR